MHPVIRIVSLSSHRLSGTSLDGAPMRNESQTSTIGWRVQGKFLKALWFESCKFSPFQIQLSSGILLPTSLQHEVPTRFSAAVFAAKAAVHRGLRLLADRKLALRKFRTGQLSAYPELLAEFRSPLWTNESKVEELLLFGKVQNLRRACARLDSAEIPAGAVFSFWKQLGRASRAPGYVKGRELRQGCMIPTIGGGLCQISNALYDLALRCGCEIVERHAHTAVVSGAVAEEGRDATVFWNYVDLRFRANHNILITAKLSRDELVLSFRGRQPFRVLQDSKPVLGRSSVVNTCTDCEMKTCFRHSRGHSGREGRVAFLIDECWPEFNQFVQASRDAEDELYLPFQSPFLNVQRYRWESKGFARVVTANVNTIASGLRRRMRGNGQLPIAAQIQRAIELADFYGRRLSISSDHLYVAQSLLPRLLQRGDLGGRTFSVLMTRLPLYQLHERLDELALQYPERKTFKEFRAPQWMVEAEREALEEAKAIITPHAFLAALCPEKTKKLEWKFPGVPQTKRGRAIVFPGPSVGRKGAYELRDAVKGLSTPLLTLAGTVEEAGFWEGLAVTQAGPTWLQEAAVVVQPAFIENAPRVLLRALAAGIPVIATAECGIRECPGLTLVASGDVLALRSAITRALAGVEVSAMHSA